MINNLSYASQLLMRLSQTYVQQIKYEEKVIY